MQRREFLQVGAIAGVGVWSGLRLNALGGAAPDIPELQQPAVAPDGYRAPNWLCYARSVYFDGYSPPVYPHLKDFDARRLLEVVQQLNGNLLRFQPIGYWAYYPSGAFPVHEELGGRDLIDEVAKECRRADVYQYCYIGYGAPAMLTPDYVEKHPKYKDWVLRNPEGKAYGTYSHYGWMTPLQKFCKTGDAYRQGLRQVVREICEHDVDGVYFDAPSAFGYTGVCFCDSCRIGFKKFSGMDLDRLATLAKLNGLPFDWGGNFPDDVDMEALIAWYAWANQLAREDLLDFRKIAHDKNKFMLCHNANTWSGTSLPTQYRIPDGFMVEASREIHDRLATGMLGASMARPGRKLSQMYLGSYALTWFGEPPHERPLVSNNTNLEDGDEIRMEGFTDLACGNVPLYATANRLYFKVGSGSAAPAREIFDFMVRFEPVLKDSVPVPYMTIVPTWESLQRWREKSKTWNWPMMSEAMGLAMLDQRISFDIRPSTEMSDEWLQSQKVISLCGASGISNELAKRLTAWVEQGGGLLATYDSGLYDANGRQRQDGGALREVLGVKMKGGPLESQPECYYRVKEAHGSLGAYGSGAIVEGDGTLVPVEATGSAKVVAEMWNLGTNEVRGPAIVANTYGRGRTIYISGSLEANYLYDRVISTGRLLRSVVEYLAGGAEQPFKLEAPRGVYGVLRQTTNGDLALWLLANVGFKDAAAGLMRQEFIPTSNVKVGIRIPLGHRVQGMHLLRADHAVPYKIEKGYAIATLSSLHIAEVVHLKLA
jgi:hypothetical protein